MENRDTDRQKPEFMCQIDNLNVRTWSRVINMFAAIGDEDVNFDISDSELILTVFDAALAVSARCSFFDSFFLSYSLPRGHERSFKIPAKCILKPFKSLKFLTKSCKFCEISAAADSDIINIKIECKFGAQLLYTINMSDEGDLIVTDCHPDKLKNCLEGESKSLLTNLNNFGHTKGLSDLTLKTEQNQLLFKNCANDLLRKEGKIYTEVWMSALEFERMVLKEDSEVTFPLKDFKSFVAFAEHMKIPIGIHFQTYKEPVIVTLKNELMEASLMLAAKMPSNNDEIPPSPTNSNNSTKISSTSSNQSNSASKKSLIKPSNSRGRSKSSIPAKAFERLNGATVSANPVPQTSADKPTTQVSNIEVQTHEQNDPKPNQDGDLQNNPSIETNPTNDAMFDNNLVNNCEGEDVNVESLRNFGRQPPRKKLRKAFNQCTETYDPTTDFPDLGVVLVPDSEDED